MKKIITLSIFALLLLSNNSGSQVTEEWVKRYNGPGNNDDRPYTLVTDPSGNVYVTGFSIGIGTDMDYATVKYNSYGIMQWEARYNGPGNSSDLAISITVDGTGNVYVTGKSLKSGSNYDIVTIKYDASGVQQWAARYDRLAGYDVPSSITVDGSGNVYLTGSTFGSGSEPDFVTIKYNSSGIEQWVAIYNGPGNTYDAAISLAVDGSGNVYVTGQSDGLWATANIATVKYSASGVQQWVKMYNGAGNNQDMPASLFVDGSGNVYVAGYTNGIGTYKDYTTLKYNTYGVLQWASIYNGPANYEDKANSLKVDVSGNVYVTGNSTGIGTYEDYATLKYNSSGILQWVTRYNGPASAGDWSNSLALDLSGNVYVTGTSGGVGSGGDYATIKYNAYGVQQWVSRYNGPGNAYDAACSIALDGAGNVYVTGESCDLSGSSIDYATIKYSQSKSKLEKSISLTLPNEFLLEQNYPNPFNPSTTIKFALPVDDNVVLTVNDISGKEVSKLIDQKFNAGYHEVKFDGSEISSGIYFYKITTSNFTEVKKMILVK